MSVRADVLLWARRVVSLKHAHAYQLLEIDQDAGLDEAQAAFHRIARMAHPDLFRNSLSGDDLELVTSAYARIAGAYQDFRARRMLTGKTQKLRKPDKSLPIQNVETGTGAAGAMTSKALVYYRKAELALRRGNLGDAVLHLKLAIAADPLSGFLRAALAEVEAEVSKKA